MSLMRPLWALWILLIFGVTSLQASGEHRNKLILQIPEGRYDVLSLDGFVDLALVKDEAIALDDMLKNQQLFAPLSGHNINMGFVRTAAWMRFAVALSPKATQPQRLILSIMPNFTDELEVFVSAEADDLNAAAFSRFEMGDHSPRSSANLSTSANILPLDILPGETTTVYIRARNADASLNVSAELVSPEYHAYRSMILNILRGMWFGGMAILAIIQLLFLYFDRKRFYAYLIFDILAVGSTYFGSLGLARLLFFNEGGLGNDYLTSMSSWLGLAAGAMSIAAILELRQRYPLINLLFHIAAVLGLIGVICVFLGVNRYFVLLAGPVILLLTTFAVTIALTDFKRTPDAQYGLTFAAFGLLWAGLMATNLQRYGILPLPSWVAGSYASTSIAHFTLMTGSLAVRLRHAETTAKNAHHLALMAAHAAEQHANELVLENTHELRHAKTVAENALRAELQAQQQQVRFMEVISHQYRTPLGVIRTNLESVRLTLPPGDEANRHRLNRARAGIARLVEVLEVNLTRSRLQGPSYRPTFETVPVTDIIGSAVSSAADLLHGIALHVGHSDGLKQVTIRADREMLQLAIINLLENAFKFSAPRGSTNVWLDVFCDTDDVHIRVRDQGIGVEGEMTEELIPNNRRGMNVEHIEGTGVGLSLVKRTTDVHCGRFLLRRWEKGGAEALIILPLQATKTPHPVGL